MTLSASPGVLALIAFAGVLLTSCSPSAPVRATSSLDKSRNVAPDFTLKDAKGASVKLSDFTGKVVLLNFWATWCGPCKIEIPWFIEFQKKYGAAGLQVVGVSVGDIQAKLKPYVTQ